MPQNGGRFRTVLHKEHIVSLIHLGSTITQILTPNLQVAICETERRK